MLNLEKFLGVQDFQNTIDLFDNLSTSIFTLKNTEVTQRSIMNWEQEGILEPSSENRGWRRYSFFEYVWLKVIEEFRAAGVPLKTLKLVKDDFHKFIDPEWVKEIINLNPELFEQLQATEKELIEKLSKGASPKEGFSLFHLVLVEAIVKRETINLLVYKDGSYTIWYPSKQELYSNEELLKIMYETHVSVSITKILKSFLQNEKLDYSIPKLEILSEPELEILDVIRTGNYDSINIIFKNKKVDSIELTKSQEVRKKVTEILAEGNYQNIVIKSHKGKVTFIENTIKKKYNT